MSSSEFHERLKSKDLRDFRLGTVATSDHETPLTQSKPNPICDRTGQPVETERVFVEQGKTSCSQEIVGKRLQEGTREV